ncbi:unnamed protein product, partial [Prorocentrum cordatum]
MRKDAEEAFQVIVGDGEVAAHVRCLFPALAALVEGRAPTWLQRLRRNAALHAAAPRAQLEGAGARALRATQRGPRLGAAPDPQQPGLLLEALGVELQPCLRVLVGERGASEATCAEDLGVEVAAEPPTECVAVLGGESEVVEAVEADVGRICSAKSAAEVDGEGSRGPGGSEAPGAPMVGGVAEPLGASEMSVVRGGEPAVGADAASEFDVEDFLAEMVAASGGEGGAHTGGVVRRRERVDIELVGSSMASPRFSEVFHVEGEFLSRLGAARAAG